MLREKLKNIWGKIWESKTVNGLRNWCRKIGHSYGGFARNLAVALILVFLLVMVIYWMAPNTAHTSFQCGEVAYIKDVTARGTNISTKCRNFELTSQELLEINFIGADEIIADGQIYDDSYSLFIEPDPDKECKIGISELGLDTAEAYIQSFYTDKYSAGVSIPHIDDELIICSKEGLQVELSQDATAYFSEGKAYLSGLEGEKIPVKKCEIHHKSSGYTLTVWSPVKIRLVDFLEPDITPTTAVRLWGTNAISGKASGNMVFSYSPSGTSYVLDRQSFSFDSKKSELTVDLDFAGGLQGMEIDGMVNKASISGMDLFPSFWGWYRNNAYMAPTTLISVILSAVALMHRPKDDG